MSCLAWQAESQQVSTAPVVICVILAVCSLDPLQPEPFKEKTFLDVGCGGGILSEVQVLLLYLVLVASHIQLLPSGI